MFIYSISNPYASFCGKPSKRSKEEQAHMEDLKQRLDWESLSEQEKLANAKRYIEGKQRDLHTVCLPVKDSDGSKTQVCALGDVQYAHFQKLQATADEDIASLKGIDDGFRRQLNSLVIDVGIKTKQYRKTFRGQTFVITKDVVDKNKAYADFAVFGYSTPDKLVKRYKMSCAMTQNPELAEKAKLYDTKFRVDSAVNVEAKNAKHELSEIVRRMPNPMQSELDEYCRSKYNGYQQLMDNTKLGQSFVLDNQEGSGLYAQAFVKYKNPEDKTAGIEEVVVAVRGSDNMPDIKDDYKMFIKGEKGEQLSELSEFYEKIREQVGDDTLVTFAGHSLGGGLSTLMAYKYRDQNVKAYGQCAPDVFGVVYNNQKEFGFDKHIDDEDEFAKTLANSGADITLFNNSGDLLTRDGVYAGAKIYLYDHIGTGFSHHQVLDSKRLTSAVKPSPYDSY